jgi:lipopolysaccharide transport system permease protein
MMGSLGIKRTSELIWVKAVLNLRSEASVNYLSYAWWIIEPLLHMTVYYLVFSYLLRRGQDNYVVFLLTGLIPWLWFAKSISHAMWSILQGKQLMNQLHVPKFFFPLTFVVQDAIKQFFVFALFIGFVFLYGIEPTLNWLYVFPIIFIQLLLISGCSLLSALILPFIRDMSFIIPTALQFLMFCSGIFFSHRDIPEPVQFYFFMNPMAVIIAAVRGVLIENRPPDWGMLCYVALLSVAIIGVAGFLYQKFEYAIPRVVLE